MMVNMTRQAWKGFHHFMGLKQLERGEYPEVHFVYTLQPKSHYPRIHFVCKYTAKFVVVDMHYDLSVHNSVDRADLLMKWHKTMNDWKQLYPNLIKLKEMRHEI
jgi:hypothetical protein